MDAAFILWYLAIDIRNDELDTLKEWVIYWHSMRQGESWWFDDATESDTASTLDYHDEVSQAAVAELYRRWCANGKTRTRHGMM